jgi:hypothetical protein
MVNQTSMFLLCSIVPLLWVVKNYAEEGPLCFSETLPADVPLRPISLVFLYRDSTRHAQIRALLCLPELRRGL